MSTRIRRFTVALFIPLLAGACAGTATVRGGDQGLDSVRLERYDGPKARVAVAAFDDKSGKGGGAIGTGMSTMLTTALVNSNRFLVLERDLLDEVLREQDLGASGRVRAETAAPVGEVEGAEILLIGAVTAFEPDRMGVGGGIIGLGTLIGSAVLHERNKWVPVGAATYKESSIEIDLRAVDAATSRVLFTSSVEAKGVDWGGGIIAGVGGGRSRLPLAFGGFQSTATEKAVRKAIDLAVVELARRTPTEYFRHRADDFASGRMAAFAFVDIEGLTGESAADPGVRVASTPAEWAALARDLGLAGKGAAPPVNLAVQRVAAVFGGAQSAPGISVSIEKAVAYPDRLELTATLVPAEQGAETAAPTPGALRPMALVRLEQGPPVTVVWGQPQP